MLKPTNMNEKKICLTIQPLRGVHRQMLLKEDILESEVS
jgi:hypothetical protein